MTKSSGLPLLHKTKEYQKRSVEVMGALYEDVEKFFGDIFAYYARFVVRFPLYFIIFPVLICGLLGLGLLKIEYEYRVEKLYTPVDGKALRDKSHILGLFSEMEGGTGSENFYSHQQVSEGSYSEVIVTCKTEECNCRNINNKNNILNNQTITEVIDLYNYILGNVTVIETNQTYQDLCAKRNGVCVVNGKWVLDLLLENNKCLTLDRISQLVQSEAANDPYDDITQVLAINNSLTASGTSHHGCIEANALKLRFNLQQNGGNEQQMGVIWEKKFLEAMSAYSSQCIDVAFTVSKSIDIDIRDHVGQDTKMFLFSVLAILVYATIVGAGGNWVSNHVILAYAGVLAALMSIMASFGFLSLCGMKFVNMCGVMPFLIIGKIYFVCFDVLQHSFLLFIKCNLKFTKHLIILTKQHK